nr:ATP synthase CF1 delta subunit [Cavernulicola chilensis]
MRSKSISAKITQPYAEAFLEIAKNNDFVNEVNVDAERIIELIAKTKKLEDFFANPLLTIQVKKKVINEVFLENINRVTLTFLYLLADRNRLRCVSAILEKYLELAYKYTSTEIARIYSATELSDSQEEALSKKLQEMTSAKDIKLIVEIKPELIGGFRVHIGSQVVDTTINSQLSQLAYSLGVNGN